MRKAFIVIIGLLQLFLFVSCNSNELLSYESRHISNQNEKDIGSSESESNTNNVLSSYIDTIEFTSFNAYLSVDIGDNLDWWKNIYIYGKLYGSFSDDDMKNVTDIMNNDYSVKFLDGEKHINSHSAIWNIVGRKDNYLIFMVTVSPEEAIQQKTVLDSISTAKDGLDTLHDIGKYTIQPVVYSNLEYGFVCENPLDLLDTVSENMTISYKVAIPAYHDQSTLTFSCELGDEDSLVTTSLTDWEYDDATTLMLLEQYKTLKTPDQLKDFRVYSVYVNVTTKPIDTVIQPNIIAHYNNEDYSLRTEPIFFSFAK